MIRAALVWLVLAIPAAAFPVERCVNLANALDAPYEGAWGYVIADTDISKAAEAGFDTVRLPVRFSARTTPDGIDRVFLDRVDHVIRTALDHDLNVILDLHHFHDLTNDPPAHTDRFVAIWTELASHYANWPSGLMFELLNEANETLDTAGADALFDRVIPIIRQSNPDRWIVVGGGDWNAWQQIENLKVRDDRVAYTFHYYSPFDFTHQEAEWVKRNRPPKRHSLTKAEAAAIEADFRTIAAIDRPLLLGEFGTYHKVVSSEDRAIWMKIVRRASEAAGIGWCHWGYAPKSGFRLLDDDHAWLPDLRQALFD